MQRSQRQAREVVRHSSSSSKNWLDESDSDEEQSYALMAEFEDASPIPKKVPQNIYNFDTDKISDLKSFP